jgi:hypothetical protein
MKLDVARLCLDCEEVHDEQVCPLCGSEVFAYLTRWVQPSGERRTERRNRAVPTGDSAAKGRAAAPTGDGEGAPVRKSVQPRSPEQLEAYRQLLEGKPPDRKGLLTKSALGLAALGLAGWAWKAAGRPGLPERKDKADDTRAQAGADRLKPKA